MQEDFLNKLDKLSMSKSDRKKEEYLKKLKDKKLEKKKNKKKNGKLKNEQHEEEEDADDADNKNTNFKDEMMNTPITSIVDRNKENYNDIQQIMKDENIEIEYVDEDPLMKPKMYDNFKNVFEYFVIPKKEKKENNYSDDEDNNEDEEYKSSFNQNDVANSYEDGNRDKISSINMPVARLSKKKRKMMSRMKISELKGFTDFPEVVEAWDVTALDPILLTKLKSMKNTITVPKHWSQKRKFLQNKRGVLKPPFKLPDFIEATGISKIRDNTGQDRKALKQKMRERMQPKLGKMDIDYQVLHDAFFRYQTKPGLTIHGDVYYENKEYENKMRIYKPGRISDKLRAALGIPENSPPPWIVNMQRYGPPSAYSNLKIPGVNAPLLDPTAEITPNLWTPPVNEEKPVLVYDFSKIKGDVEHWGDFREVDEDEISEDLNEDMSIEDETETRPVVDNLFSGMDLDLTESKLKQNFAALMGENANINVNMNMVNAVPNPNANIVYPNMTTNEKTFYTILEQKGANIKQSEIYGSSYKYVIPGQGSSAEQNIQEEEVKKDEINKEEVKNEEVKKEAVEATTTQKKKDKKLPSFKF